MWVCLSVLGFVGACLSKCGCVCLSVEVFECMCFLVCLSVGVFECVCECV